MKLRNAACLGAALILAASSSAMAQQQNATPKPKQAPGIHVERVSKLMVGDRAPELKIQQWVKGDEVTGFEDGKVYVVEFWATWCGPCIAGMPHVSEIQKEYKDKNVTVIGVNIWDDPANVEPFMQERGNERMQYTVAIEKKIEGENPRHGYMSKEWMADAGQRGIPTAFIVDQNGYIAWIGHPMNLDKPLEKVVEGKWDLAKAAEDFTKQAKAEAEQEKNQAKIRKAMQPFADAVDNSDFVTASKAAADAITNDFVWENPQLLNYLAWNMVDPDAHTKGVDTDLAVKIAKQAVDLTQSKEAAILDTLAWAYYAHGDEKLAIQTEKQALEMVSGEEKEAYTKSLKRMMK